MKDLLNKYFIWKEDGDYAIYKITDNRNYDISSSFALSCILIKSRLSGWQNPWNTEIHVLSRKEIIFSSFDLKEVEERYNLEIL